MSLSLIALSHGDLGPSNIHASVGTRVHNPNDISISSVVFAQITAECRYTYNGPLLLPLKLHIPKRHLASQGEQLAVHLYLSVM